MDSILSPNMATQPRPPHHQGLAARSQHYQDLQLPLSPQTMINDDGSDSSHLMLDMALMPSPLDMVSDFDPNPTLGALEPVDFGWRGDQLPLVVQDLLSGFSTY